MMKGYRSGPVSGQGQAPILNQNCIMTRFNNAPHHVAATPQTIVCGYFDATTAPVLTVPAGTEVIIDTVNGHRHELPNDPFLVVLPEHRPILDSVARWPGGHLLTGPVAVEGGRPGDALVVDILGVAFRQNWGFTSVEPLLGTLPEEFPDYLLRHLTIDTATRTAKMPWGGALQLEPFFGIMGVAPPPAWGRISSVIPRAHGGNMDNKVLIPGTRVLFPVFNNDVLFSVGDGHAVQGDGEVCVTALETSLTGHFRLDVQKGMDLSQPRAETPTHLITMGFDEDLDQAAKHALRDMLRRLGESYGLAKADAYILCSLAADLRVTQTVNVAKGIHCMLPKAALPQM